MDLSLTSKEVKNLGFETLYSWTAFQSVHVDLYEEILDTCALPLVEATKKRREVIKLASGVLDKADFDRSTFTFKQRAKRLKIQQDLSAMKKESIAELSLSQSVKRKWDNVSDDNEPTQEDVKKTIKQIVTDFEAATDKSDFMKLVLTSLIDHLSPEHYEIVDWYKEFKNKNA